VRRTGTLPGPARIDAIRLEGVHFGYRPDRAPALQDVSFDVAAGARIAVVGPVGCGKTTLLRLLAGLLPPERGALLVNGQPHGAWTWPGLRSRIGYVPQDARLFSDTVLDNVSFGREVGEAQVRACLRIAQVADEVDAMSEGLATRLGRGGARVSGGQRQRIAIARALAGRPDLLLLDDCTASLDAENEERFWRALGDECPGLTVIVVSHRLATIRRADTILVLEAGRLVDRGGHEELAGRCATYKSFLLTEEVRRHLQAVGTPG
jgi:ABC-type multidrug transport system fused ATPase/permease subunit